MCAPVARSMHEFHFVVMNDSVVALDEPGGIYHTLSPDAYLLLRACDGQRSLAELSQYVYGTNSAIARSMVEIALIQLVDAGLLDWSSASTVELRSRRHIVKLAAATLAGAIGLPMVQSITLPDSAAAETQTVPLPTTCGEKGDGDYCTSSEQCEHCCCCKMTGSGSQFCATSGSLCGEYGWPCVYEPPKNP